MNQVRIFLFLFISTFSCLFAEENLVVEKKTAVPEKYKSFLAEEVPESQGTNFTHEFIKMIFVLGFLLILIFLAMWVFKRIFTQRIEFMNKNSSIKILESRSISPKANIHLLEVNGTTVLLSESPAGVHPLAQFPPERSFKDVYKEQDPAHE
jgi:flagellar biogenesis protein FliO